MKIKMLQVVVNRDSYFACAADHGTRGHPHQRERTAVGSEEARDHPFGEVQEPIARLRLDRQRHRFLTFITSVGPTYRYRLHVASRLAHEAIQLQIYTNRLHESSGVFPAGFGSFLCIDRYTRVLAVSY